MKIDWIAVLVVAMLLAIPVGFGLAIWFNNAAWLLLVALGMVFFMAGG